jgi:hypothetical protein
VASGIQAATAESPVPGRRAAVTAALAGGGLILSVWAIVTGALAWGSAGAHRRIAVLLGAAGLIQAAALWLLSPGWTALLFPAWCLMQAAEVWRLERSVADSAP